MADSGVERTLGVGIVWVIPFRRFLSHEDKAKVGISHISEMLIKCCIVDFLMCKGTHLIALKSTFM